MEAKPEHAQQVCQVLIDSIKHVCVADHHHDPNILKAWLNNKIVDNVTEWLRNDLNYSLIALNQQKEIMGVSMFSKETGKILLNYVLKEYLRLGIGSDMLKQMELCAINCGLKKLTVSSTLTAAAFYEAQGFRKVINKDDSDLLFEKLL